MDEVIGKLSPEQYYKWRLSIEQMHHAQTHCKVSGAQLALLEKDHEILKLKVAVTKNSAESVQSNANLLKDCYNACKSELEKELGMSLSGVVIDEVTFEIKKLNEDK